jgi:hypothetical protein
VGEAYVHGVMNGEAIEMWKRGELEQSCFPTTLDYDRNCNRQTWRTCQSLQPYS